MAVSHTQKFELMIIFLSITAAFTWGAYLGDYFPFDINKISGQKVLGTSTLQEKDPQILLDLTDPEMYFRCEGTADCVAVQADCCGCEEGGDMKAVNRSYKDEYLDSLDCKNYDYPCTEINTCYPQETLCHQGMCYLKEPTGEPGKSADLNLDTKVDAEDYSIFLEEYEACEKGSCSGLRSDLNNDGIVSILDQNIFMDSLISD